MALFKPKRAGPMHGAGSFGFEQPKGCVKCLSYGSLGYLVQATLFDTSLLARQTTQVEQTGTTYFTATDNFDFIDVRRQQGEDTLGTNLVRNLAHGECFAVGAGVTTLQHNALELLNALLGTFADFHVHVNRVAGGEQREAGAALLRFGLDKVK